MTDSIVSAEATGLDRLSGKITDYKCTRGYASFVFTETDRNKLGVVATVAALAGMGAQAASVSASASATEEAADYIEFGLNGCIVKGWVWRSPFKEGDVVDVAAQWQADHYEAYGIARPLDRMVALYPHCSRSYGRHVRNAIKWWAIFNVAFFALIVTLAWSIDAEELLKGPIFPMMYGPLMLIFILMFASLAKQFMPFVRLSEKVFIALDLPNPRNIDLVESSKRQRAEEDPGEFGTFYFRY